MRLRRMWSERFRCREDCAEAYANTSLKRCFERAAIGHELTRYFILVGSQTVSIRLPRDESPQLDFSQYA